MSSLEKKFLAFINSHCDARPLLMGFSGGPDSMALFHLLLRSSHPFAAAHIDHGWRTESAKESAKLSSLCKSLNVPFYLLTLEKETESKNLEEKCRLKRLAFFKEIVLASDYQGLMLAHHADDQAETVLKRVFEGSSLHKLKGLQEVSLHKDLKIFRPLLSHPKKTLVKWLEERNIPYFLDSTNADKKFLRSRLRIDLFPMLHKEFGKEVSKSLLRIGKHAGELERFLQSLTAPFLAKQLTFEGKVHIDFEHEAPNSTFLWKAVLREFFNGLMITFSDSVLESLVFHMIKGSSRVKIRVGKRLVCINKRNISVTQSDVFN